VRKSRGSSSCLGRHRLQANLRGSACLVPPRRLGKENDAVRARVFGCGVAPLCRYHTLPKLDPLVRAPQFGGEGVAVSAPM
jgi:hypothetical protein